MNNIASRPLLDGKDLDTAIIHVRHSRGAAACPWWRRSATGST